jgi:hypothetical protein
MGGGRLRRFVALKFECPQKFESSLEFCSTGLPWVLLFEFSNFFDVSNFEPAHIRPERMTCFRGFEIQSGYNLAFDGSGAADLLLQQEAAVKQRFGGRRAAWNIDVDRLCAISRRGTMLARAPKRRRSVPRALA